MSVITLKTELYLLEALPFAETTFISSETRVASVGYQFTMNHNSLNTLLM